MWKLIQILTIAVLVNGSYYSFNFAFWASGPNTKMILALFGLLWFLYDSWRGGKGVSIPRVLLGVCGVCVWCVGGVCDVCVCGVGL